MIVSIVLIAVTLAAVLCIYRDQISPRRAVVFDDGMSIRQLAASNGVPVKEVLHIVGHEDASVWQVNRNVPVRDLYIASRSFEHALAHIQEESDQWKSALTFMFSVLWLSFVVLVVLHSRSLLEKRAFLLLIPLCVLGVLLGATPNPMEAMVKFFKFTNGMEGRLLPVTVTVSLFILFSCWGRKLFCGWACPLGALQETLFNIPLFKKKYRIKVPFVPSLLVRFLLFCLFLCFLYGIVFGIRDFVIFHHLNLFKLFGLELSVLACAVLPVMLLLFLLLYRPYCHYICPFGLFSWVLEKGAMNTMTVDRQKCISCGKCVECCPTDAMKNILQGGAPYRMADCWSCGRCIAVCPVNALTYE